MLAVFGYIFVINLAALAAFYADKRAAKAGQRRISEKTLLLLAVMGGSVGALVATKRFRHKRLKGEFMAKLYGALVINVAAIGGYLYLF
jgi:uncharacterized membrane protein YsdA (DUF1294 family)